MRRKTLPQFAPLKCVLFTQRTLLSASDDPAIKQEDYEMNDSVLLLYQTAAEAQGKFASQRLNSIWNSDEFMDRGTN